MADRAGHVVVCGAGAVGFRTVEQLHAAGVPVVVVEAGDRAGPVAEHLLEVWAVPRIPGRPRDALVEAGIAQAAAVVVVPDDDLVATECALLARRLAPDARLVVRVANPAVGRALGDVAGRNSVLDVAALAAPSVVETCLGRRPHPVELGGREFVVATLAAPHAGTLRALFRDLAPLAAPGPDGDQVVCPGRDHPVGAGEEVTLIGTREQFAATGHVLEAAPENRPVGARAAGAAKAARRDEEGGRASLLMIVRTLLDEAERPLKITVCVLLAVFAISVVVLRNGYVKTDGSHMTWVDAIYFTVETIGTVGYGDFSFAEQQTWLRVYAIGMMFFGVVLAAVLFALLTQLLVSSSIEKSVSRRRLGSLRGHVIVVGLGAVGIGVLEGLLRAGARPVVLERDTGNRHLARARALGVPVVTGDATEPDVLASVNLAEAAAVAVLTSDDLVNIEAGLAVRDQLGARWKDVPVVLRVFDRDLSEALDEGMGFRHVRSTAALAAPWFVGAALGLDVLGTFYAGHTPFMVGGLTVGGGLDGVAMRELSARTRVVALHRADGALEHPPRRDTRFAAGDHAYVVGPYEELLALLRRDTGA